ncbi:MAG TPA: hypothetical protein VNW06_00580 [Cytophagaceae bacterium]|nr:hypothetical protein [Cytophagaceae bacterium]
MNKKKQINVQRLLFFAWHLENKCRHQDYPVDDFLILATGPFRFEENEVRFFCPIMVIKEIVRAFPTHWKYLRKYGLIVYHPNLNLTSEEGLVHFFGLSGKQYCRCFVPNMAQENIGFKTLRSDSGSKEIAHNIYTLVGLVSPFQKRMVLVEKIIK